MAVTTTAALPEVQALYNAAGIQGFADNVQFIGSGIAPEEGDITAKSATWYIWPMDAPKDTELPETSDDTAETMQVTPVTLTLKEQGGHIQTTKKLRLTSFTSIEDQAAINRGSQAARSLDLIARKSLDSQVGSAFNNVTTISTVGRADILTSDHLREARAQLRSKNVPTFDDGFYRAYVHPHCLKDLKKESGEKGWTFKAVYSGEANEPIKDEVGIFEGFRVIECNNINLRLGAGAGTTPADIYSSYYLGKYGLGVANSTEAFPKIFVSQPVHQPGDAYARFQLIGWYAFCAIGTLMDEALYKMHTGSSMGAGD